MLLASFGAIGLAMIYYFAVLRQPPLAAPLRNHPAAFVPDLLTPAQARTAPKLFLRR